MTIPCGKLFGIELRIHLLLPVLLGYLILSSWRRSGPDAATDTAVFLAVLVASVLAHELGHGLASRALRARARWITLTPFGGATFFEDPTRHELPIALAGPVASGGMAALVAAASGLGGEAIGPTGARVLSWALSINLAMVVVNLLPAFPLDGGRVARAALGGALGPVGATRLVRWLGFGAVPLAGAVCVAVWGEELLARQSTWVLAAAALLVIDQAGRVELAQARAREDGPTEPDAGAAGEDERGERGPSIPADSLQESQR